MEGNVYYDGIPINAINLDALKSSVTIIPQMVRGSLYMLNT
jgi:ABC-type multidrug transport system fused ATPase/permease subunit